jgi:FkbM family methyltransferase
MLRQIISQVFERFGYLVVSTSRYQELRSKENYKPSEDVLAEHLRRVFERCQVDCVFDVGANDGAFVKWLRESVGFAGQVVSFEPIPAQVAVLAKKAADDPRWMICPFALGRSEGMNLFHVMESDVFSSFLKPGASQPSKYADSNKILTTLSVKVSTVAKVWEEVRARLGVSRLYLKMDTQGFDLEVFAGATSVLGSIVALQSEVAFRRIYEGAADFHQASEAFASAGFRPSMLHPISFDEGLGIIEADGVFVRDQF